MSGNVLIDMGEARNVQNTEGAEPFPREYGYA